MLKNLPPNAGDIRDVGLIPGSRRSSGGGHNNPLQYPCLENPMDRGAWRATVPRVAPSQTWLKWLSTHAHRESKTISQANFTRASRCSPHGNCLVCLKGTSDHWYISCLVIYRRKWSEIWNQALNTAWAWQLTARLAKGGLALLSMLPLCPKVKWVWFITNKNCYLGLFNHSSIQYIPMRIDSVPGPVLH